MRVAPISFKGKPINYGIVDKHMTRSGQPQLDDLKWLKEQGVTDIVNVRLMYDSAIPYNEETAVKELGMNYHNIPSVTKNPTEENVKKFLEVTKKIKDRGGKMHVHCKAGADRTGMYVFIYKQINKIGSFTENIREWIKYGHHYDYYTELIPWAKNFLKKVK